ncbi:MAG TPA: tetratricopeptide repeat protein [Methylococcus sp.]|nr:tetratricopeptide repeat protein [Methylococcus sp.]
MIRKQPASVSRPAATAAKQPPAKSGKRASSAKEIPQVSASREKSPTLASPPVVALMADADKNRASGQLDNAAALLERAIRIQPRNAELWHRLAAIRLEQHQPGLARDLARKSSLLAQGDPVLREKNQAIVEAATHALGNSGDTPQR